MGRVQTRPGRVFGRLTVVERVGNDKDELYRCRCTCGGEKTVRWGNLRKGSTKSCGCLAREVMAGLVASGKATREAKCAARKVRAAAPRVTKHDLYLTWRGMKNRCYVKTHDAYRFYGARGIKMCDRWLNSFWDFVADIGPRPAGHTIDRKDSDADYTPDNCRWANKIQQAENIKGVARVFVVNLGAGVQTIAEVCKALGVDEDKVKSKIKSGERAEKAVVSAWFRKKKFQVDQGVGGYGICDDQAEKWLADRGL